MKAPLLLVVFLWISTNVFGQVSANFTMDKEKGCAPLDVQFTNTSTGIVDSCYWELGIANNTSRICNPGAIYATPGIYSIKLTVYSGDQKSSITKNVIVSKNPTAAFDGTPLFGCVFLTSKFTNLSVKGDTAIKEQIWSFGDGKTDTSKNPTHVFAFSGNFTVSLIVKDHNGCTNTLVKPNYVASIDTPTIKFSADKTFGCEVPTSISFTSQTDAGVGAKYKWYFGDGDSSTAMNPTHVYRSFGKYTVTLIIENSSGCISRLIKTRYIDIHDFEPRYTIPIKACAYKPLRFWVSDSVPLSFVQWDFGNGQVSDTNVAYNTYTSEGTYDVVLITTSVEGCSDTVKQQVVITEVKADFIADKTKSCTPFTVNMTNLTQGADTFVWMVIYKDTLGEFDTLRSTLANPSFYLPEGSIYYNGNGGIFYDVYLYATSAGGCKDTMIKRKYIGVVYDSIVFFADKHNGCDSLKVKFTFDVVSNNFHYIGYDLYFGDGNFVSINDTTITSYTYTYPLGTFQPYIHIKYADAVCDRWKCIYSKSEKCAKIRVGPYVEFSGSIDDHMVCVNDCIRGIATSDNPNTMFEWFPSGIGSPAWLCFNMFPTEPNTTSVVLITNTNGCIQKKLIDTVRVMEPKAIIGPPEYCFDTQNPRFAFVNNSIGADSSVWDFGDSTILISNDDTVRHSYTNMVKRYIKLTVFNFRTGCSNTDYDTIFGYYRPDLVFTNTGKACSPYRLKMAVSTAPKARLYQFKIDHEDPLVNIHIVQNRASIDTLLTVPGRYNIRRTILYGDNCESIKDTFVIVSKLIPDFSFAQINGCNTVQLTDNTVSLGTPITEWKWQYADGTFISNVQNPLVNLKDEVSIIKCIVKNGSCIDSITKTIQLAKPKANFITSDSVVCAKATIQFTNTSQKNGFDLSYFWDFGDGSTSNLENPTYAYIKKGVYDVRLVVKTQFDCYDTIIRKKIIKILNTPPDFSASPRAKSCPDLVSKFTLIEPTDRTKYNVIKWYFGNLNVSNDLNKMPTAVYTYPDSFDVKLITLDTIGCTDTLIKENYIIVGGPKINAFDFIPKVGCVPLEVLYTVDYSNTINAVWDFGDGTLFTDDTLKTNILHTYLNEGSFTPTLLLRDSAGCTALFASPVPVLTSRLNFALIPEKRYTCGLDKQMYFDSIQLTTYDTIKNIQWQVNQQVFDNIMPNSWFSYEPTTAQPEHLVVLQVITTSGCKGVDSIRIRDYNPDFIQPLDKLICNNESVMLNASGAQYYLWSPKESLDSDTIPNPIANPTTTTQYICIAYDTTVCTVTDTVLVVVKPSLLGGALADDSICKGDSVRIYAFTEASSLHPSSFSWTPITNISNPKDSSVIVYPATTTTYEVTIDNGGTCIPQKYPVSITVLPSPQVTAQTSQTVLPGTIVEMQAIAPTAISYLWEPPTNVECVTCPTTKTTIENDITYTVTVKDENLCEGQASLIYLVGEVCDQSKLFIPTAFTPNNDGENDVFRVKSEPQQSTKLLVFDRWGNKVFESDDILLGWNGMHNNQPAPADAYSYIFSGNCPDGTPFFYKGNVTLLR
ncbi:MAG: PKD domain-containing protein [Chitinophagales bacterium]|nr:PKD domain-containing protein [Chitinophagales bacterium]